jgi:hypothetical protein
LNGKPTALAFHAQIPPPPQPQELHVKPSLTISEAGIFVLLLAVLPLVLRALLAVPVMAPLDPAEGWNAAHALAVIAGQPLYPAPQSLMVNNAPPLFFYLVAGLARHSHDPIVIGRWLSMLALVATSMGIAGALRLMRCNGMPAIFGGLFFAAVLLVTSRQAGVNDPQLLAHALQMAALVLLLREKLVLAAALFAVSLFFKHTLVALPLAGAVWLIWQDYRSGFSFLLWTAATVLALLIGFQLHFHLSLLDQLASPRLWSFDNLFHAGTQLWWILLPLAASVGIWPDRASLLCGIYAIFALVLGLGFAGGDGVGANAFFDLAIALSLTLGLAMDRGRWPELAAVSALPLILALVATFHSANLAFTPGFRAQARADVAFVKSRPGPALCQDLALCQWAQKPAEVDAFNIGEQIKTGTRDPRPLAQLIASRHFTTLQLSDLDAMGAQLHTVIAAHYRVHHTSANGTFLIPN